jgi:hypothetical protein
MVSQLLDFGADVVCLAPPHTDTPRPKYAMHILLTPTMGPSSHATRHPLISRARARVVGWHNSLVLE